MLDVIESCTKAYEDGQASRVIFIDLAKDVDRAFRVLLQCKVDADGNLDPSIDLLRSFLINRSFIVIMSDAVAKRSPITWCVFKTKLFDAYYF